VKGWDGVGSRGRVVIQNAKRAVPFSLSKLVSLHYDAITTLVSLHYDAIAITIALTK